VHEIAFECVEFTFNDPPVALSQHLVSLVLLSVTVMRADVPSEERLELLKCAILLLPDVHRETLQCLLLFLSDMAKHSQHNQATSSSFSPLSLVRRCLLQIQIYYGPRSRGDNTSGSVRVSVHLSVGALLFEPFDL